jgi:hypothetical protein
MIGIVEIRKNERGETVARAGGMRNSYRFIVQKSRACSVLSWCSAHFR